MCENDIKGEVESAVRVSLCGPNLKGNELRYVSDAIKSQWVSNGNYITSLEKAICSYVGIKGTVACQSGTSGIHLSMIALGIREGDEVIVPTVAFIAAVNPVRYVGAYPVFMDCDNSLCMDPEKLEEFLNYECVFDGNILVNKATNRIIKAIIVVHVFGNLGNMDKILELAKLFKLKLVEDATEALGSYYVHGPLKGKYAGTMGDIGVFSFNGNKIITTGGGGAVVSNDNRLLEKIRFLSGQAKNDPLYFVHDEIGYNYRMSNIQAAIGLGQIEQIEKFIEIKNKNYEIYKKFGIELLPFNDQIRSNKWFYAHLTRKRKDLINYLLKSGVEVRPLWMLVHLQKCYCKFQSYKIEKARYFLERIVNLPCGTDLCKSSLMHVVDLLKKF
ncbi:MAG: LegC family aminotransferase [Oscillospiraceae bacterium]|nr:LegC family aminotransferase [Oscillospiraceae bacterium]